MNTPKSPRKRKPRPSLKKWKKGNRVTTWRIPDDAFDDPWVAWITPDGEDSVPYMACMIDRLEQDDKLTYGKTERQACERLVQPNKLTPLP